MDLGVGHNSTCSKEVLTPLDLKLVTGKFNASEGFTWERNTLLGLKLIRREGELRNRLIAPQSIL